MLRSLYLFSDLNFGKSRTSSVAVKQLFYSNMMNFERLLLLLDWYLHSGGGGHVRAAKHVCVWENIKAAF